MPVDHTKNIIELRDVCFGYRPEKKVLCDINLNIHRGDYLGIIGPNGGGKTTLLKLMLGLLKPTEGTISLFGQDVRKFTDWTRIGYVPQRAVAFDTHFPATVEEVVSMGRFGKRGLFRWLNGQDWAVVTESLRHVEMEEFRKRQIGDLSGGQQQRVFIARALAEEPEVIFLDEPTAGVDIKAQEQFYQLLKKLNTGLGLTLVLVSHEIDVVTNEATEIACINQTLMYHGTPREFIKEDFLSKLYGKEVKFILHGH